MQEECDPWPTTMTPSDAIDFLGRAVRVTIDRPLGSHHPRYGFRYPVNYGYVPGTVSADGEELDAYVLAVGTPIESFSGICVAAIERLDDQDDKLVVVPRGTELDDELIRRLTHFQERFFESRIVRAA